MSNRINPRRADGKKTPAKPATIEYNVYGDVGVLQTGAFANVVGPAPDIFSRPSAEEETQGAEAVQLASIDYIYLPRLASVLGRKGEALAAREVLQVSHLAALGMYLVRLMVNVEKLLPLVRTHTLSTDAVFEQEGVRVGETVPFRGGFRTKNMPNLSGWSETEWREYRRSGNLANDPHIYRRQNGMTVYVTVDPRYITTSTAHSRFLCASGGRIDVGGVGIVTGLPDNHTVVLTPLVMGVPGFLLSR